MIVLDIRLSGICRESSVDGEGLRYVVFTQGCKHGCIGCHNPKTHDINGGYLEDTDKIIEEFKLNKILRGITISGGEPMLQANAVLDIAKSVKKLGKTVWVYTGYTWEQLMEMNNPTIVELLNTIDVLVDGKFEIDKHSDNILWRGSSNQRVIDSQRSICRNQIIQYFGR